MSDIFGRLIVRAFTNKLYHIAEEYQDTDGSAIYINDDEGIIHYKLLSSDQRSSLFTADGERLISWSINASDVQQVYLWDNFTYTDDFDAITQFLKLCGWTFKSEYITEDLDDGIYTLAYAHAPSGSLCMIQTQKFIDNSDCQTTRIIYKDRCIFKLVTREMDEGRMCILHIGGKKLPIDITAFKLD